MIARLLVIRQKNWGPKKLGKKTGDRLRTGVQASANLTGSGLVANFGDSKWPVPETPSLGVGASQTREFVVNCPRFNTVPFCASIR